MIPFIIFCFCFSLLSVFCSASCPMDTCILLRMHSEEFLVLLNDGAVFESFFFMCVWASDFNSMDWNTKETCMTFFFRFFSTIERSKKKKVQEIIVHHKTIRLPRMFYCPFKMLESVHAFYDRDSLWKSSLLWSLHVSIPIKEIWDFLFSSSNVRAIKILGNREKAHTGFPSLKIVILSLSRRFHCEMFHGTANDFYYPSQSFAALHKENEYRKAFQAALPFVRGYYRVSVKYFIFTMSPTRSSN